MGRKRQGKGGAMQHESRRGTMGGGSGPATEGRKAGSGRER